MPKSSNREEDLKTTINLNRKIGLGTLETPYKIPLPTWLVMLSKKIPNRQPNKSNIKRHAEKP